MQSLDNYWQLIERPRPLAEKCKQDYEQASYSYWTDDGN